MDFGSVTRGKLLFGSSRGLIYSGANALFFFAILFGTAVGGGDNPRILYLLALFALCSSPILYLDHLNGRYTILTVLMTLFFVYYGAQDLVGVFTGQTFTTSTGAIDLVEMAIIIGAAGLIAGYRAAVLWGRLSKKEIAVNDWSAFSVIAIGLMAWIGGVAATAYWHLVVERVQGHSDYSFSPIVGMALILGQQLLPMSMALLAYRLIVSKSRALGILIVCLLAGEFFLGFVADSKELSIRGILIVILAKLLVSAEIPKKWLLAVVAIAILAFPIFQAYRYEVLQERSVDRITALKNIGKALGTALSSSKLEKARQGGKEARSQFGYNSALGRISLKPTMEILVHRAGKDVAFQNGHTIGLLAVSLVPRVLYSNKPDTSVGQLFNRQFHISDDLDTYISATHLGELYWNFGWAGLIFGAPLMGLLLGTINSRFALHEHRSVTRFLVLVVTIYFVCLRFEGSIALQYTLWIRSLILIGVGHLILARRTALHAERAPPETPSAAPGDRSFPFPNLLR